MCFVAYFLLLYYTLFSQQNGDIINRENVIFPDYHTLQGIDWYYPETVYDNAIHDSTIKIEKLTYWSEGLKVVTFLAAPAHSNNEKHPIIIFNRGSYLRHDIAFVHAPLFQKFVQEGFIVIAPALRESEGSEGKDELGGADLNDIKNIYSVLSNLDQADTSNLFMLGESRGGMMTFQALRDGFPVRAAATVGAFTDLELFNKENPGTEDFIKKLWKDYDINKKALLERRSVIHWADKINIPLLLLQGGGDPQVSPMHALNLATKLQELNKVYQLMIFKNGNHILSGDWTIERDRQIISWFKQHMK